MTAKRILFAILGVALCAGAVAIVGVSVDFFEKNGDWRVNTLASFGVFGACLCVAYGMTAIKAVFVGRFGSWKKPLWSMSGTIGQLCSTAVLFSLSVWFMALLASLLPSDIDPNANRIMQSLAAVNILLGWLADFFQTTFKNTSILIPFGAVMVLAMAVETFFDEPILKEGEE